MNYQHQAVGYEDFLEDAQIAAYKSIMDRNLSSPSKSNNEEDDGNDDDDEDDHENVSSDEQEFI